jgi:hypothetical protein
VKPTSWRGLPTLDETAARALSRGPSAHGLDPWGKSGSTDPPLSAGRAGPGFHRGGVLPNRIPGLAIICRDLKQTASRSSPSSRLTWSRRTRPGPALGKPLAPVPRPCSPYFIWSRLGIGNSSIALSHPLRGVGAKEGAMRIWQLHVYLFCHPQQRAPPTISISCSDKSLMENLRHCRVPRGAAFYRRKRGRACPAIAAASCMLISFLHNLFFRQRDPRQIAGQAACLVRFG